MGEEKRKMRPKTGRGRERRKGQTSLRLHLTEMAVASLRRFRAALIGPTQGLPKKAESAVPICKLETPEKMVFKEKSERIWPF